MHSGDFYTLLFSEFVRFLQTDNRGINSGNIITQHRITLFIQPVGISAFTFCETENLAGWQPTNHGNEKIVNINAIGIGFAVISLIPH